MSDPEHHLDERAEAVAKALADLPPDQQFAVVSRVLFRFFARGPDKGRMEFYVHFFGALTAALVRAGLIDEDQLGNRMMGGQVQ